MKASRPSRVAEAVRDRMLRTDSYGQLLGLAVDGADRPGAVLTVEAREESLKHKVGVYQVRVSHQRGVLLALFKGTAYRTSHEML